MNNMVSAVVLTKNEEKNIERCLKSLSFCNEIILVDDHSTDKTKEIAKKYGSTLFEKNLENDFSAQRNFGMSKAQNRWVLFIDADEEVTPELAKEIKSLDEGVDAYYLRRRDFWWGRELKFGETIKVRNNGTIRLIKKNSGSWRGTIHETFVTTGVTARMHNFINHYPHQSIKEFLVSINEYSTLRAHELKDQGKKCGTMEIIFYPLGKFILTYFIRMGFMDGPAGFAYSFFMSFHSFLVRAKLYQYLHFHEKKL